MERTPTSTGNQPQYPQVLVCVECQQEFVFPAKAQQYFAEQGYTEPPKRCKSCHNARKQESRGQVPNQIPSV